MEFKPEHDEMIAALSEDFNAIMRNYRVRLTPTGIPLLPADLMPAFDAAMALHVEQVSALSRIIARQAK